MKSTMHILLAVLLAAVFLVGPTWAAEAPSPDRDRRSADKPAKSRASSDRDRCIVSRRVLGSMGPVYAVNESGTTVRFCCHRCLLKFANYSDYFLKKLKTNSRPPNAVL